MREESECVALQPVDIAPLLAPARGGKQRQQCERDVFWHCQNIGFLCVQGHGVAPALVQEMRATVQQLFAIPRASFAPLKVSKDNYRGYVPQGFFTPNDGRVQADQYEAWKLHWEVDAIEPICQECSLYGPNRWPTELPNMRDVVLRYWHALDRVCEALLDALDNQMGIGGDTLVGMLHQPLTNMTLLNYPASEAGWGIHPHKDFNLLTILAHDPVGGLEIRDRSGRWLPASCPETALLVNVGDMLELLSGGRLVSTPHRVKNRSGRARQSFPYFSVPRYDVEVRPLLVPIEGFNRSPLMAGQASADIWRSNWPASAAELVGQDLGDY